MKTTASCIAMRNTARWSRLGRPLANISTTKRIASTAVYSSPVAETGSMKMQVTDNLAQNCETFIACHVTITNSQMKDIADINWLSMLTMVSCNYILLITTQLSTVAARRDNKTLN